MRRAIRLTVTVLALALVAAACGVKNDSSPRDVPEAEQVDLVSQQDLTAGQTGGTQRIYLVGPDTNAFGAVLEGVSRDATTPKQLMDSLLAGPNADEVDAQLRTAIPVGTRLLGVSTAGATLRVDLSEEILQLSGSDLADALAQIVFTASELARINQVRILVNGQPQQWPIGDGTLQSTSLDVYDYPGRVASSQPAYPATPPPPQQR